MENPDLVTYNDRKLWMLNSESSDQKMLLYIGPTFRLLHQLGDLLQVLTCPAMREGPLRGDASKQTWIHQDRGLVFLSFSLSLSLSPSGHPA